MAGRGTYSSEDKARAFVLLKANDGNLKRTARDMGVPPGTLRRWRSDWETEPPAVAEVEQAANDFFEVADRLRLKALARIERMIDADEGKMGELNAVAGTLTDKIDRARGLATSRIEHQHHLPPADELRALLVPYMQNMQRLSEARDAEIVEAEIVEQPALSAGK